MKTTNKSERNWVVVLEGKYTEKNAVYVGELDCGRQGVRKLENATRFTQRGAMRVLGGYPSAVAAGAHIMQVSWEAVS